MNEWRNCKLGDVLTLKRGYDLPTKKRISGQYPIVSSNGVSGFHNEYKVKGPGVTTGRSGTLGKAFYVTKDFWPLNTALYVEDFKGNNPRFIYYFLNNLGLEKYNAGSGVPTLNRNHVHPIEIKFPSINIQNEISNIIGSLDDKIDLNQRINETLEQMASAIYKHWFIDRKLEEYAIEDVKINEFSTIIGGGTPKTSVDEYWGGNIPWISVKDLDSTVIIETEKSITELGLNNSSTKLIPKLSTVISARGTIGNISLLGIDMAMNQSCYAIKPNQQFYGFTYLSLKNSIEQLISNAHGSVFNTITKSTLESIDFPYNENLCLRFEEKVGTYLEKILTNVKQNKVLRSTRDYLLPRLLSGEIVSSVAAEKVREVISNEQPEPSV